MCRFSGEGEVQWLRPMARSLLASQEAAKTPPKWASQVALHLPGARLWMVPIFGVLATLGGTERYLTMALFGIYFAFS